MVENKKINDYMKDYRSEAGIFPLPTGISQSSRRRKSRSYSTMSYEWAVYRSKGKPLSEYRALPTFEAYAAQNYAYFKRHGRSKTKVISEVKRLREASAEARRFERHLFQSLNSALGVIRANLYSGFAYVLFENYFYKNLFFYWLVWVNFYVQEYLFTSIALYFPILDWVTINVFFVWPVHVDLYFLRFACSVFFVVFIVFVYFQRRFNQESRFDFFIGLAHFGVFFGSIFAYHLTGAAPFLFFVVGALSLFVIYNFYYFIPRILVRSSLASPLLLPAPRANINILLLAAPRYAYPFKPCTKDRTAKTYVFTRFPFTSFNIAGVAAHIRFVRGVLSHSLYTPNFLRPLPVSLSPRFDSKLSLSGTSFDTFYKFNPYDYYENSVHASFWREEDHMQLSDRIHEEEDYIKPEHYMYIPTVANNITFFAAGFRRNAVSLYRNHFTAQFDTFGSSAAPRLPAWQMALLNDPYFELYIWLKNIGPRYGRPHPQSALYVRCFSSKNFSLRERPYLRITQFLEIIYGFFEKMFDELTLNRFIAVRRDAPTLEVVYTQFVRLAAITSKFMFRPSFGFIKSFLKFVLAFERRLENDDRLFFFLGSARTTRYELTYFISTIHYNFSCWLVRETQARQSVQKKMYLRAVIRALNRLLLRLSQPFLCVFGQLIQFFILLIFFL